MMVNICHNGQLILMSGVIGCHPTRKIRTKHKTKMPKYATYVCSTFADILERINRTKRINFIQINGEEGTFKNWLEHKLKITAFGIHHIK